MLQLTIPEMKLFNSGNNEFIVRKEQVLQLEHSLVSISNWEKKWHKPFLDAKQKTDEETADYVRCMTLTQHVDPETYQYLDPATIKKIMDYIEDPMTATWFAEDKQSNKGKKNKSPSREVVTSELIYYWMIELQIPVEFQKWHLNRLITLIKVCNLKKSPPKKMSKRELLNRNRELNEKRKAELQTRG